jgi:purine-binding chemotaxis protein CheW
MINPVEQAQELKLAVFRVGSQLFAMDIMQIRQIIRPLKITPLPKAPEFVEGMINLRGMVIPVLDMRKRFEIPIENPEAEGRVIIANVDRQVVGLMVDEVTEVIIMPPGEVQPPPKMIAGIQSEFLMGVCRYAEQILLIVNLNAILTSKEKDILLKTRMEKKTRKGKD